MLAKQLRSIRDIATPTESHNANVDTLEIVPEESSGDSSVNVNVDVDRSGSDPIADLIDTITSTPLNERLAFLKDLMNYSSLPDGTSKLASLVNGRVHGAFMDTGNADGGNGNDNGGGKMLFVTWLSDTNSRISDVVSGGHTQMVLFNEDNIDPLVYLISLASCLLQLLHKVTWTASEVKHSRYDKILRSLFKLLRKFLTEFNSDSNQYQPTDVGVIGTGENSLANLTRDVEILLVYVRSLWDTYRLLYLTE